MSRSLAAAIAAALVAGVWTFAQGAAPAPAGTFRLYLLGREIGRETATLTIGAGFRRLESVVTYTDSGQPGQLTATLETAADGTPRRLVVRGKRLREGPTDLEATIAGGRVQVRDGAAASTLQIGNQPIFPVEGPLPVVIQEQMIRFWRGSGRLRELPAAPIGPLRIEPRAGEEIDLGGRSVALQRLAVEGPVWGRETAWIEPGGTLIALMTWVGGLPLQAVREGYEARLPRFTEEAMRDRLADADRFTQTTPIEQPEGVVLAGATVVVGGKRPAIPEAMVVVRGGRIAAVGPASRVKAPADLPKLDVAGMTIIAGLWDLHGQVSQVEWAPVYLASGITTVVNTSPDAAFTAALRTSIVDDRLLQPRLIPAGFIDGPDGVGVTAGTAEDGRQAVRRYRGDVRQVEVSGSVAPPVLRAMVLEANRLGLAVASRVADASLAQELVDAGLDRLEGMPQGSADMASLFATLVKHQVFLEPWAAWSEFVASDRRAAIQPLMARAPFGLARRFVGLAGPGTSASASVITVLQQARAAGVRLVAGTGPGMPGSALIRELELFVQAGMSAADALQAATSVAAQATGQDDAGTVEEGKRADLVILSASPLDNITNLRTARWVVAGGKLYDVEKLWKAAGFTAAAESRPPGR